MSYLQFFLFVVLYIFTNSALNLSTLCPITNHSRLQELVPGELHAFVLLFGAGGRSDEHFVNCKVLTRCAGLCFISYERWRARSGQILTAHCQPPSPGPFPPTLSYLWSLLSRDISNSVFKLTCHISPCRLPLVNVFCFDVLFYWRARQATIVCTMLYEILLYRIVYALSVTGTSSTYHPVIFQQWK